MKERECRAIEYHEKCERRAERAYQRRCKCVNVFVDRLLTVAITLAAVAAFISIGLLVW